MTAKKTDNVMVMYKCDNEVIICHIDEESQTLREYFLEGGRRLDEYDRLTFIGAISFDTRIHIADIYEVEGIDDKPYVKARKEQGLEA